MKSTILLYCAMAATVAHAQSWVSASAGNDGNSCARVAPCRTFQRAVTATAAWGQVGVLDPGDYGSVTIPKAMTIDGGNLVLNVASSGVAITVNAGSGDVVQLRNMVLHGSGSASSGIQFNFGGQLVIEGVKVNGFGGHCILGSQSPYGFGGDMVVKDSSVDNCSGAGILVTNGTAEIVNTQVHFANFGLVVYNGNVSISGSSFSSPGSSSGNGIFAENALGTTSVIVDNSEVSGYTYGIYSGTSGGSTGNVQVSRTTIYNNVVGVGSYGSSTIVSNGNNSFFNNGSVGTFTKTVALQ